MPGDNLKFEVELIAPIAMEEKLRFAIRSDRPLVQALFRKSSHKRVLRDLRHGKGAQQGARHIAGSGMARVISQPSLPENPNKSCRLRLFRCSAD